MEDQHNELLKRVQNLAQLLAAPSGPGYGFIRFDDRTFRDELVDAFVNELPDFQHIVLELAPTQVDNLVEVLREKMPPEILESPEIKWIIHVINLEVSLYHETWTGEPAFMDKLNDATETLSSEFPFITLMYGNAYLTGKIQQEAPDFWQAIPLKENFEDPESEHASTADQVTELKTQLDQANEAGSQTALTQIYGDFGKIIFQRERPEWALELLEQALTHREVASDQKDVANALLVKGMCLVRQEDMDDGLELIDGAIDIYSTEKAHDELAKAYFLLGQLYQKSIDAKESIAYYRAAAEAAEAAEMWDYLAAAHQVLARLQERLGDLRAAAAHHAASARAFVQDDKPIDATKAWQQHGGVCQDQNNWQSALEGYQKGLEIAKEIDDDFFISALEDSIVDMEEKVNAKQKRKKGFFGKLLG